MKQKDNKNTLSLVVEEEEEEEEEEEDHLAKPNFLTPIHNWILNQETHTTRKCEH